MQARNEGAPAMAGARLAASIRHCNTALDRRVHRGWRRTLSYVNNLSTGVNESLKRRNRAGTGEEHSSMKMGHLFLGSALALALPQAASAAITWTDWQQAGTNTVIGTAGAVGVTYTGSYQFAQTNGGIAYWDSPNWDGTAGRPSGSDIVALNSAGTKTITFSTAVAEAYVAIMSWNGQSNVTFSNAFTQEGWVRGCGYWGCGVLTNVTATSFTSNGESHGLLKFAGPITSLTFTESNNENWHGIQVGITAVPEPSTWALLILGFGAVGGAMRQRRRATLAIA